ncbi:MAG: hypothetical protein EOP48_20745 [Sphingobacteriales bacterium]|nr:MAG: hypothetical protein EOP48_20745 [Sphingobacteriales bacterium]
MPQSLNKIAELRKLAKELKTNHMVALELWSTREYLPRQLSILIMDKKQLSPQLVNFTAGWIGVYDKQYRKRCIAIGENTGLYKDKMVSKGCTPEYLPEFIRIESEKRKL